MQYWHFCSYQGFMVQTGDPTNTGKGGESIWGGKFQVRPCFAEALLCDTNPDTRMRSRMTWSTRPEEFSQWPTLDPIPTAVSGSSHMPPSPPLISSEQQLELLIISSLVQGTQCLGRWSTVGTLWTNLNGFLWIQRTTDLWRGWRQPSMQSPSMQIPWLVDLSKTFFLFQNIPFQFCAFQTGWISCSRTGAPGSGR